MQAPSIGDCDAHCASSSCNESSPASLEKVLDRDGSRDFFGPSRKLNRWAIISAFFDVVGSTGVWSLVPASGVCRDVALAGRVATSRQDHYLRRPGSTCSTTSMETNAFCLWDNATRAIAEVYSAIRCGSSLIASLQRQLSVMTPKVEYNRSTGRDAALDPCQLAISAC